MLMGRSPRSIAAAQPRTHRSSCLAPVLAWQQHHQPTGQRWMLRRWPACGGSWRRSCGRSTAARGRRWMPLPLHRCVGGREGGGGGGEGRPMRETWIDAARRACALGVHGLCRAQMRCMPSEHTPAASTPAAPQIQQEVEVQLAEQVRQVQAEQRRAARQAAKLGQQVQQHSAHVLRAAARKDEAATRK